MAKIRNMEIEIHPCAPILAATATAIKMAGENGCNVTFDFNGIRLTVDGNSCVDSVVKEYNIELQAKSEVKRIKKRQEVEMYRECRAIIEIFANNCNVPELKDMASYTLNKIGHIDSGKAAIDEYCLNHEMCKDVALKLNRLAGTIEEG